MPPRVLLVGADRPWSRAVRTVADGMGGISVDAVASGQAAMACLLAPHLRYTHVLLNPARDDGKLRAILGLTCDEEGSGREMLLLGRVAGQPPHACVIAGPTRHAIGTALTTGCRHRRPAPPSVAAVRDALDEGRIDTRYQPVVWLADGRPAGLEVLARMRAQGRGLIAPERFVRRIEDAGLARQLTAIVARLGLADVTAPALAPHGLTVALNFPLDVLLVPDLPQRLDAACEAAGLPATRVVLELTESRVVSDLPQLRLVVQRLRRAGYGVAIDDLGPAEPHREALLDMPFTAVKLDRTVVRRSAVAAESAAFMQRIIAAAKQRGQTVIVEGVADMRTWRRMRHAGADMAQGFIIGRPMPAAVLPDWLAAWRARSDFAGGRPL